jgi:MFS family permease
MRFILMTSSFSLLPLVAAFLWSDNQIFQLIVLSVVVFLCFGFNSMLIIIGRSYFGKKVPADRIGKVTGINGMFVLVGVALGGYLYGLLFDWFATAPGIVFLIVAATSAVVGFFAKIERKEEQEAL